MAIRLSGTSPVSIWLLNLNEKVKQKLFCFLIFCAQIWGTYFNLAVEFLTQPSLQLEKFSEVKRGKIIEKYGDMRVLMGRQILSVWSDLGKKFIVVAREVGPHVKIMLSRFFRRK
jgi:dedicator of cytokinesis protein 3